MPPDFFQHPNAGSSREKEFVFSYAIKSGIFLICLLSGMSFNCFGQNSPDSLSHDPAVTNGDNPTEFLTRVELYNEMQHYDDTDTYLNQTIFRTIVKIGKRFTTRLDLPLVHNSISLPSNPQQTGLGDISFRVLGFKFLQKPNAAVTASIEVSLNTAESPILGSGKNLLLPVLSYTKVLPKEKMFCSVVFQQTNSVSGDEDRSDISFSKVQLIAIKIWTRKFWTVLAPEWYIDYINGGTSMNLRSRFTYAPTPRVNIWTTPSAGIYGDFFGRYEWGMDVGIRYFLMREANVKKGKRS